MRPRRAQISITAGFCIGIAIALCILPLNWVCGWLLAMGIHEISHCVAVLGCGGTLQRMRLGFLGAQITADMNSTGKEIFCSLAGPVGGLLLLMCRKILPITAICSTLLSIYNLLPLQNLDGGRALESLLHILVPKDHTGAVCIVIDRLVRMTLLAAALFLSWRMRWSMLALFTAILLFGKQCSIKSACKHKRMQVQ